MKSVAELAGVSVATVSRVVNGEKWVSRGIGARVQAAIDELGYRPDVRARAMRNSALAGVTVGVIHADLANLFFTGVHAGIEEVADKAGWLIVTASSRDRVERQEVLLRAFVDRRVDGLIVVPAADSSTLTPNLMELSEELRRGTPVVFVDRQHDEQSDLVVSDNYCGAMTATQHLIAHGHTAIAFLGDDERLYSTKQRLRGFRDAMAEARLPTSFVSVNVTTAKRGEAEVRALLSQGHAPTAFFTAKNHSTVGAVQALHQLGLQGEVALVGFDDVMMGNVIQPGLSVVAQDAPLLGRTAGELLLQRITGERSEPCHRTVPVRLIRRGSGEIERPRMNNNE